MSFQLCVEWISVYVHPHRPSSVRTILPLPTTPVHSSPSAAVSKIMTFDEDGGPLMRSIISSDLSLPIPARLGGTSAHIREVVDTTVALHILIGLPAPHYYLPI